MNYSDALVFAEWGEWSTSYSCSITCSPEQTIRERICIGGCSDVTIDDLKELKVLEFIEVEPDKLVWNDAGTGTWMSGPSVGTFDPNFFDPWSERFQRNAARETAFSRISDRKVGPDHLLIWSGPLIHGTGAQREASFWTLTDQLTNIRVLREVTLQIIVNIDFKLFI